MCFRKAKGNVKYTSRLGVLVYDGLFRDTDGNERDDDDIGDDDYYYIDARGDCDNDYGDYHEGVC